MNPEEIVELVSELVAEGIKLAIPLGRRQGLKIAMKLAEDMQQEHRDCSLPPSDAINEFKTRLAKLMEKP